jgi:hypothetical protein
VSLETFGWILVALGLVTFVYGYLKASARLDEEEHWAELRRELERQSKVRVYGGVHDWEREGEL